MVWVPPPIYTDSSGKWFHFDGNSEAGPFETFEEAAADLAKSMKGCKDGSCES